MPVCLVFLKTSSLRWSLGLNKTYERFGIKNRINDKKMFLFIFILVFNFNYILLLLVYLECFIKYFLFLVNQSDGLLLKRQ